MKFSWRPNAKALLARRGYVPIGRPQSDIEPEFLELCLGYKRKTLTNVERMYALYKAVEYVATQHVPGEFVECGVWRGGSAGMTEPTDLDIDVRGISARERWAASEREDHNEWGYAPLEEVQHNICSTGFPMDRVHLIAGRVEDTIPGTVPEQIAILRLDTDFYESTAHELRHLMPLLSPGGDFIVDDYGHWAGSRRAVDEYFVQHPPGMLRNRIDVDGRIGVRVTA
jgi:O-methyltransferase